MANLLAHALAGLAFCGVLNIAFGLPSVSWGIFAAGFLAMFIELDLDDLSENNRSPIGHSVFFGVLWVVIFSIVLWGVFPSEIAIGGTLAIVSAYTTHLLIDVFTKEGIYLFPKGLRIGRWIMRLSQGDEACWGYWVKFQNAKLNKLKRGNDDPILNAIISVPSLLAIILFVALMPLPR
jgi:membrane-bound metal-dependent hydrolase YbcI (DUF457 family)